MFNRNHRMVRMVGVAQLHQVIQDPHLKLIRGGPSTNLCDQFLLLRQTGMSLFVVRRIAFRKQPFVEQPALVHVVGMWSGMFKIMFVVNLSKSNLQSSTIIRCDRRALGVASGDEISE